MSNTSTTVLAVVISAGISIVVSFVSYITAQNAIKAKMDELKQTQMLEIIRERIKRYPALWEICHENISRPAWDEVRSMPIGWEKELLDKLQQWYADNGAFVSQDLYSGLWYLRRRLRSLAASPTREERTLERLDEIEEIWSAEHVDHTGQKRPALATLVKDDLGSYWKAALSTRAM